MLQHFLRLCVGMMVLCAALTVVFFVPAVLPIIAFLLLAYLVGAILMEFRL